MTNKCRIPRCQDEPKLTYMGREICWRHWNTLAQTADRPLEEAALLTVLDLERIDGEVRTLTGGRR